MKKAIVFLLVAALFASIASIPVSAATKKPVKKVAPKKVTKVVKKKTFAKTAKNVLGANTFSLFSLVTCNMPDGKTIKVPKKDCDAVTAFWNSIKPSNPSSGGSNNGGGNSGGSSSSNNSSNNNSGPHTHITSAEVLPCGSSSCGNITTVKVAGVHFSNESRIELIKNGITYSEKTSLNYSPDASLVGGNGSTEIIMDFYNLPSGIYEIKVQAPGKTNFGPLLSI